MAGLAFGAESAVYNDINIKLLNEGYSWLT